MKKFIRILLGGLFAAMLAPAHAIDLVSEDTDIFLTNPSISAEVPNVLIILDNTSNWSAANQGWSGTDITGDATCGTGSGGAGFTGTKQGDAELCAIYKTVATLTDAVNVGLMMINDQDNGGYVRFAMASMSSTNRTALQNTVKAIETTGITDPTYKTAANTATEHVMNDAFRYFNSFATYGGSGAAASVADGNAYTSSAKTTFNFGSAASTSTCGYDYIIWIGNGWPSGVESSSALTSTMTAAANLLNDSTNVTPNTTPTSAACQGGKCNNTDAWARFLYNYGAKVGAGAYRHITTYTVDVCNSACDTNQAALLNSMATLSYGRYFKATNLSAIVTALQTIFSQVQAVNSVFAATTLPVSINVRGTNLNQVYIGVFRPDGQLSPRWLGNLKMYKLGVGSNGLQLIDATGTAAINLNTGFVANTAKSYWTSTSTFFSYRSPYSGTDVGGASDSPDGDLVEKGGAAEQIRVTYPSPDSTSAQTRTVYTCTGSCPTTAAPTGVSSTNFTLFNTSNTDITSTLLGTYSTLSVTSLSASGQTATAVTSTAHGFSTNDSVVVAGASPSMYNGTFTVLSVPTTTSFTYSLSPNTPDTTHAYVTFNTLSSSGVTQSTDTITVASSSPSTYNVTAGSLSAVAGNTNQLSYTLASAPTSAASGYTVTANRRITSLTWDSSTRLATVGFAAATGYTTSDSIIISGVVDSSNATDSVLNGTFTPTTVNSAGTQITYSTGASTPSGGSVTTGVATTSAAVPSTWSAGARIQVTGVTGTDAAKYNVAGTESGTISQIASVGTNSLTYYTNGTVTQTTTGTFTAKKYVASDTNAWTISSATAATSGNGANATFTVTLTLTLNCLTTANTSHATACSSSTSPTETNSGQIPTGLSTSSSITVAGISCTNSTTSNKGVTTTTSVTGCTGTFTPTAVGTPGSTSANTTFTVSFRPASLQGNSAPSGTPAVTVSSSGNTVSATSSSVSAGITITQVAPGTVTVTRTGSTMYAAKTGDLTNRSLISSITSQSVASGTITAASASSSDPNELQNLINWVRGLDNKDNENLNNISTDVRASVHGDVLHSRPAVINYNRNGDDNDVYIFYGANDGQFHAVKGGTGTDGGLEQWTFVAPEFFGKLKRLRDQSAKISSTTQRGYFFDGPIGAYTKDADGNGKLEGSSNTTDKVYLFIGMRRGGRYYYALDVSNPAVPKLLWKKGCPNATGTTGCDAGWAEIGQTWSEPKLGYVRAYGSSKLVMFFGAGYDAPVEDIQPCGITAYSSTGVTGKATGSTVFPNTQTSTYCGSNLTTGTSTSPSRSMGRGVYMVDAATGSVLWRVVSSTATAETVTGMTTVTNSSMKYSIAGDLAVLKNRSNTAGRGNDTRESVQSGYIDRVYAADTGGNVWRIDVADSSVSNWVVNKFASVAGATQSNDAPPADDTPPTKHMRKFMFNPDVVYSSDGNGDYDAVLLGSGDREHPFDQTVVNRFYAFKDYNTGTITPAMMTSPSTPPSTVTESNLTDLTDDCLQATSLCTGTNTQTNVASSLLSNKGWYVTLNNSGEKVIAPATTSAGTVIFNTNQPKQDTVTGSGTTPNVGPNAGNYCTSDLGTARQYGLDYQDATSNNIYDNLASQYRSSTGRYATFAGGGFLPAPVPVVVQIDGKYYQTVISGVQATNPGGLTLQTRVRSYWYKQTQ